MSLIEEIKRPEGIEAATYGRHNNALHDEIAQQMAEWERSHKVTVIPIGQSSEHKPLATEENLKSAHANSKGVPRPRKKIRPPHQPGCGVFIFDHTVNRSKDRAKSGHTNLVANKNGTYGVKVGNTLLGSHELEKALEVRDKFRAVNGLPPAEY